MQVYTLIRKGDYHPVFCEDYIFQKELDPHYHVAAVMDGCSSGKDSHFASALIGKLVQKIVHDLAFSPRLDDKPTAQELNRWIVQEVFVGLKDIRKQLSLTSLEILATLLLCVYDRSRKQAFVHVIGDGFVAVDGTVHELDQQNRPRYLAYYLEEPFASWYASQEQFFSLDRPQDLSISTDGVDSFRSIRPELMEEEKVDPIQLFLCDTNLIHLPNMLTRKFNILEKRYKCHPGDDVGIVRMRFVPPQTDGA